MSFKPSQDVLRHYEHGLLMVLWALIFLQKLASGKVDVLE